MSVHHIVEASSDGRMKTACGLTGCRAIGGGLDIGGKWANYSTAKTANDLSCKACAAALFKALPARLKPPTIYTALKEKLGREPSNRELIQACADEALRLEKVSGRRHYAKRLKEHRAAAARHAAMKKAAGIGDQFQNRPGPAIHGAHKPRKWKIGRAKK